LPNSPDELEKSGKRDEKYLLKEIIMPKDIQSFENQETRDDKKDNRRKSIDEIIIRDKWSRYEQRENNSRII
jgi:hypothetical protein